MRKLLIASQSGGVGKTTTAINLACAAARSGTPILLVDADPLGSVTAALNLTTHAHREPLRDLGLNCDGTILRAVTPGLDVLPVPYADADPTADALADILDALDSEPIRDRYPSVILDAAPATSAAAARQLLRAADQLVIVVRAEPLAYRMLPAFLEVVRDERRAGAGVTLRGLLLTLPASESFAGRWEAQLRQWFGPYLLPQTIPYAVEVGKALLVGRSVVDLSPGAPAAVQYRALAETLGLARDDGSRIDLTRFDADRAAGEATVELERVPAIGRRGGRSFVADVSGPPMELESMDAPNAGRPPAGTPEPLTAGDIGEPVDPSAIVNLGGDEPPDEEATVDIVGAGAGRKGGHGGDLTAIAFGRSGGHLATAGWDRTIRFWDVSTGEELAVLEGHAGVVSAVLFSPDGQTLASAGWDKVIKLWDLASGAERSLTGHAGVITSIAFSPDGKRLASGSWDKTIKIWDTATGRELATGFGHDNMVTGVAFAPDGRSVGSASWDHTVKLWDAKTGRELATLVGHEGDVTAVAFAPDGRSIASSGLDRTVRLWDVTSGLERSLLRGHEDEITAVAFAPAGDRLASASQDRTVRIWDPAAGSAVRVLIGHHGGVTALSFHPDEPLLATAGQDRTIRLWDMQTGEQTGSFMVQAGDDEATDELPPVPDLSQVGDGVIENEPTFADGALQAEADDEADETEHIRPDELVPLTPPPHEPLDVGGGRPAVAEVAADFTAEPANPQTPGDAAEVVPETVPAESIEYSVPSAPIAPFSAPPPTPLPQDRDLPPSHPTPLRQSWERERTAGTPLSDPQPVPVVASRDGGEFTALAVQAGDDLVAVTSSDGLVLLRDTRTGDERPPLRGHRGEVSTVAFSADGTTLATGGVDRTVRLWDVSAGRELAVLNGHTGEVTAVAFRPASVTGGKPLLGSAGWDGMIKLWDLPPTLPSPAEGGGESVRELRRWHGHSDGVSSLAFAPDGDHLVSGSEDGTVRLWSAAIGDEIAVFRGHEREVCAVAYSPDGQTIASGGGDGVVKLWDVASRAERATRAAHHRVVSALAFSPDGTVLATAGWDKSIKLWNAATGDLLRQLAGHDAAVSGLAFAADSRRLVSSGWDQAVRWWDAATGAALETPPDSGPGQAEEDLSVTVPLPPPVEPEEEEEDLTLTVPLPPSFEPEAPAGVPTTSLADASGSVGTDEQQKAVVSSPNFREKTDDEELASPHASVRPALLLATGGGDHAVRLWNAHTGEHVTAFAGHGGDVNSVAFSPDGRRVASGGADKTARLWDVESGAPLALLTGHEGEVTAVVFSPDGKMVATASWDTVVRLWENPPAPPSADGDGSAPKHECGLLRGHKGAITAVTFSPDSRLVATGSWDNLVILWDLVSGKVKGVLRGHEKMVTSLAFSPDGRVLATGSWDKSARVWEVESGRELLDLPEHRFAVSTVAFSRDGRTLATGNWDGTVRLWDLETGREFRSFRGHSESVRSVAFSPAGDLLATAGWDGAARIWSVEVGDVLATIKGHGDKVNAVAFAPTLG